MENVVVLKSASEMRKIATDLRNEEIAQCLASLMVMIEDEARKGALTTVVKVKMGRPEGFFDLLEKSFKALGYEFFKVGENLACGYVNYRVKW